MKRHAAGLVTIALLVLMTALMATPIKEESATMDETAHLVAGYSYWHGYGFTLEPQNPPLAKMISAAPLLFMDVKLSTGAQELLDRRLGALVTCRWSWKPQLADEHFPVARDNWYFWPVGEVLMLGQEFVYGGANDADKILSAGRWMQVALTVVTGIVIFFWLRGLVGGMAGALGVALWALNPVTLAYGHLVLTDMGETLMFVLAVWCFATFLDRPSAGRAGLCGLACGGALVMKFSAVLLAPILLALVGLHVMLRRDRRGLGKYVSVMALVAGGVVLLMYAPSWSPAPSLPDDTATKIGVPTWFQVLRPVLIPRDFFKGLAIVEENELTGHTAFLCGQWRETGWWYYFPVAFAVKTPLPLLLLTTIGFLMWLRGLRHSSFQHTIPWLASLMYLLFAMAGTLNYGVRHLLPMYALLVVGTASQFSLRSRRVQLCAWLCTGWLLLATGSAFPYFIEYFNEIAGGSSNGYQWLVDSNFDWGQDVKRLKRFLNEQAMTNIDLAYFGPGGPIDYYGIAGRTVTSGEAYGMRRGTLVISASELMDPRWDWLRASHEPVARVGYTMFVYRLGDADTKERWEQTLRINPNDARAHYKLAIILERAGDAGGAITHYEEAIRIKPDFAMAHYNLGIALARTGKIEEAVAHYEQALRINPDYAEAHYNLGTVFLREGNIGNAIGQYEQALRINPDYAAVHCNLGIALARTGKIGEAVAHFEWALRINPDYAEAHYNLGTVFLQEGNISNAIEQYEQALRLKPDYAAAHFNLGVALEKLGKPADAMGHYEQALRLNPDLAEARTALTRLQAGR
jgi:Tfp pilus assembly protein PilF/4-amino-4-deoxy-L-arabinose transferase-like glycosyltransferase